MGIAMALRILDVSKGVIQTSNSKGIRHSGKDEQLGCLIRRYSWSSGIWRGIEKNVVISATKALQRLKEDILGDEKLVLGYQCLINFFQITPSSNNVDIYRQLDICIIICNDDVFRLLFANKYFKRSKKTFTGNAKMEGCAMIHIEIPDKA